MPERREHAASTVPPEIAGIIDRNASAAAVLDDFCHRLLTESKRTPFPAAEIERAGQGERPGDRGWLAGWERRQATRYWTPL